MKENFLYKISALDIQKQQRFTFNTGLYNCYDLEETKEFAKNLMKNCSEFYTSFHLVKVKYEVVEVALL